MIWIYEHEVSGIGVKLEYKAGKEVEAHVG